MKMIGGDVKYYQAIRKILVLHSSMWKPAMQNGRGVCVFVFVSVDIADDKITVRSGPEIEDVNNK
jgi:hypothetical protein